MRLIAYLPPDRGAKTCLRRSFDTPRDALRRNVFPLKAVCEPCRLRSNDRTHVLPEFAVLSQELNTALQKKVTISDYFFRALDDSVRVLPACVDMHRAANPAR
jgi:hypothetical protein